MPDIFWMHTNQLLYYADFGMLDDVTDLYDDVEPDYYEKHFSEISRNNASGSDGRLYGVPKDKDNGLLVYNKEMFDALTADRTQAGYTNSGSVKGMEFYVNMQKEDWCPDQTYFTETAPGTAFFSEAGAMYLEGNWNLPQLMENYPDMRGKRDLAKLPKCADPIKDSESLDHGCLAAKRKSEVQKWIPYHLFPAHGLCPGGRCYGVALDLQR